MTMMKKPSDYHIAEANVARMKTEFDDPIMYSFIRRLNDVNAIADRSPGFIWRQSAEANDYLMPYRDKRIIFNMSVWQSIEHLRSFVYGPVHTEMLRLRHEWFERPSTAHIALWWIPAGHRPIVSEAMARLAKIQEHGPTSYSFSFKQHYPPLPSKSEK